MTPHYQDDLVTVYHGDCLDVMRQLPYASVDAVVTDPPYGLGFMGRAWDALPPGELWAAECLRVLKPGGHLLAFGGTRTWHRLACAVEDAGFEVRDSIAWLYGSGFPKSLDVSKAIDKAAGATRDEYVDPKWLDRYPNGPKGNVNPSSFNPGRIDGPKTTSDPATPDAVRWRGWGTALKPAFEPVVVARKPLAGTVAANVLAHGTGALNIDGCRVGDQLMPRTVSNGKVISANASMAGGNTGRTPAGYALGRWPANVVLDESQAAELDRQSGVTTSGAAGVKGSSGFAAGYDGTYDVPYGDTGGASRFFPTFRYEAKAPTVERPRDGDTAHPTVKPLDLMRWLVRLVTPPGGVVLDPFAGTGTTAEACIVEGFRCITVEREASYLPLIVARLTKPIQPDLFGGAA